IYKRLLLILAVTIVASTLLFIGSTTAQNGRSARSKPAPRPSARQRAAETQEQKKLAAKLKALRGPDKIESYDPIWSEAVAFAETPAVRDLKPQPAARS